ncbi:MAG TPA: hypothetical protein ENH45_02815 [Nitrospirae bacterium]|nr:hypothetical protein BMS3Abin10_01770 [bacterium BMS3Abin10]GBE39085.1 hypothetical protein BMS3Bbin08_01703 [bacterium BMS3Bbin08]HDH50180.1 hypothetical protein [Nitrospirota bacterium]HDK41662.1 hypothetical protein [Nitrospirota bacterium]HDZ84126.1 hypothetical protein [Nitrospirota bacterium]
MRNSFKETIIEPLQEFYKNVLDFLPDLLTSILILALGVLMAAVFKKASARLFRIINLDKLSEKYGISGILKKWGLKDSVSGLLSKIIGGLIMFAFLIISLRTLNVPTIEGFLGDLFLYLPNVFVAVLILFAGYFLSDFLGRTALIASVNAGLKISGSIGKFVKLTVFFLSVTMALEQLGIGKETVLIAFAVIFGGVVLALAIAFGLGGQDAARDYIDKRLKGEEDKDDIQHL